jgi:hypothetical protein
MLMAAVAGGKDRLPRTVDIAAPVRSGERLRGVVAAHLAADWARHLAVSAANSLPQSHQPLYRIALSDSSGARLFSVEGLARSGAQAAERRGRAVRVEVAGVGAESQSNWTLEVSAEPAADDTGLQELGLALALSALGGALGWLFGRAIGGRLEELRNSVFRMRGVAPAPFQPSRITELDELSAAIHLVSADRERDQSHA